MLIKAVIFDYNGTCFDDLDLSYRSARATFEKLGVFPLPTFEQYRQDITSEYMNFYHKYGIPRHIGPRDVNYLRREYYLEHSSEAKLREDLPKTVLELRLMKIKVAIVSAETESLLRSRLDQAGLLGLFDPVKCDCMDKELALLETASELGISPSEAIYVDDSVDGNKSALTVGMCPVAFCQGLHSTSMLREYSAYQINHLSDVIPVVNLLERVANQSC